MVAVGKHVKFLTTKRYIERSSMTQRSDKIFAAIRLNGGVDINILLQCVVDRLQSNKLSVQGHLQKEIMLPDRCKCDTYLENLMNGDQIKISQDLGNGARGCKLDNSMLLKLSDIAMRDLDLIPDLLIVNRFGRSEAEGGGFRDVIGKAISMGIPVLTAVKEEHYPDWKLFSDELGCELPSDCDNVLDWYGGILRTTIAEANKHVSTAR